ncbi:MAG: response regulator [Parcubacteria group bacterium]|jgi:PleD family two-component response regulator
MPEEIKREVYAFFIITDPGTILTESNKFLAERVVVTATDSEWDATQYLLYDYHFDIVLIDTKVGKHNGLDILQHMRDDQRMKRFPVVIFIDENDNGIREKVKGLGVVDFIVRKGLTTKQMAEKIKEIFSKIESNNLVK